MVGIPGVYNGVYLRVYYCVTYPGIPQGVHPCVPTRFTVGGQSLLRPFPFHCWRAGLSSRPSSRFTVGGQLVLLLSRFTVGEQFLLPWETGGNSTETRHREDLCTRPHITSHTRFTVGPCFITVTRFTVGR